MNLLFHSLNNMRRHGILSVSFNVQKGVITVADLAGTLTLHPNQYANPEEGIANYNYVHSSGYNGEGLNFDASYSQKKKFKEICPSAIKVGNDLHVLLSLFSKLPQNSPMRDKTVFSKKEDYRKALLDHLKVISQNDNEFQFFKGTQRVIMNQIELESITKVPIRIQKGDNFSADFQNIAIKLARSIYASVNGELKEQISKELSRRKELRFHVEMYKSYILLQAFCSLNLSRSRGETAKSQAKTYVTKHFPQISLENMSLMLQRAPRIYRLLLLSNGDWRLIDPFEELTSCFFKSSMKSGANFELWLNLVKTGQIVNYEEGNSMYEEGKKYMKEAKFDIIKTYFDGVNEDLKDYILDDDDE